MHFQEFTFNSQQHIHETYSKMKEELDKVIGTLMIYRDI